MTKRYEELENRVKEIQEEINRLKREERDELPRLFERDAAIEFLERFDPGMLDAAFIWESTPQGDQYWRDLSEHVKVGGKPPLEAVAHIQKWVIQSFVAEYGK